MGQAPGHSRPGNSDVQRRLLFVQHQPMGLLVEQRYDELCAPAVGVIGDTMIVFGSTYTKNFTLWMSTNPKANEWKPLVDSFAIGGWDPAFFTDDDGRLYMYNGSSNKYPVYGVELNRRTFEPIGTRKEIYLLEPERYGWQRFGEYMD